MRLTRFTDYSLRVLIYLSTHEDQRAAVAEIAQAYNISRNHLMKVILFLSAGGYVETIRGKGGGVRLKMNPDQIHIGALVRKAEEGSPLVECFSSDSECCIEPVCILRDVFEKAVKSFYTVLDDHTLSDLIHNRVSLQRLLHNE